MKKYSLLLLAFLVTIPVVFAQQGWKYKSPPKNSNGKGAICPINKDTVYVIADGGLFFETYDGGTNWTTKTRPDLLNIFLIYPFVLLIPVLP
jgi:hypothetical protein